MSTMLTKFLPEMLQEVSVVSMLQMERNYFVDMANRAIVVTEEMPVSAPC